MRKFSIATILIAFALCLTASADTMHTVTARVAALKHKLRHNHLVTGVAPGIEDGALYVLANCPFPVIMRDGSVDDRQFTKLVGSIPTTFQGVPVKIQCNVMK